VYVLKRTVLSGTALIVETRMQPLVWLGIVLVVLWAILWLGLKLASGMLHLLVVVGLALVIWGLIKRGARAIT
jgi:hypothetical protein